MKKICTAGARLALSLLALASAACHSTRPIDATAWIELVSPHFTVRTDLAADDGRAYLVELEHMRDALFLGSWHGAAPPPGRLLVTLVADRDEASEFMGAHFSGFATSNVFGDRVLVFSAAQSPPQMPVLKHELTHWLNGAYLLRMPRWLNEGLACYLETARTTANDSTVTIGEPDPVRLSRARHYSIDYGRVLDPGPDLNLQSEDDLRNFYAGAWALVHYLIDSDRPRFTQYLHRLARAEDPKAAFQAVYPDVDAILLAKNIYAYVHGDRVGFGSLAVPAWHGDIEIHPLSPAELRAQRANLLLISFGTKRDESLAPRVMAEVQAALSIDPNNPLALAILFQLTKPEAADRLAKARAAAQAHPDDERAFRLLANQLATTELEERIAAYTQAVQLAPEDPIALNGLAWSKLSAGHATDALPFAEHAVMNAPGNPAYLDTLASIYAAVGRCAEGQVAEQRAVEVISDGASEKFVERLRKNQEKIRQQCAGK